MTTFAPIYRMTVNAPRSVDPTETTVLTPVAGAPHSDPFVVATATGIAGARPYLGLPSSRGATIDPINKKTSIGSLSITILDARIVPGGGNAQRWVTAFVGDGTGGNLLIGRLCVVEQSVNGGLTWTRYWTGRIGSVQLSGKLGVQLTLRDIADDLNLDVFVGPPHAAATYAAVSQLSPIGLLRPQRTPPTAVSSGTGYAGMKLTAPLRGTTFVTHTGLIQIRRDISDGETQRALVTQSFITATMSLAAIAIGQAGPGDAKPVFPTVMVSVAGANVYRAYDLRIVEYSWDGAGRLEHVSGRYSNCLPSILIGASTAPGSAPLPPAGVDVDFYITSPNTQPSPSVPLLVDDVNPVTYARDLCAGYFGRLDATGAVTRAVPFDDGGIDGSKLIPYRNMFTAPSTLNAELEALCLQYNWAYYVDASGTVVLVDLSRALVTAAEVTALSDDDLESTTDALVWQQDRTAAVTALLGKYYPEMEIAGSQLPDANGTVGSFGEFPDIPAALVQTLDAQEVLVAEIGPRSSDMKSQTLTIDAKGMRYLVDDSFKPKEFFPSMDTTWKNPNLPPGATPLAASTLRVDAIQKALVAYSDEIRGPFGLGPSYIDVVCRRSSARAFAFTPGRYAALTFSALPDPATNQRGGVRLGFCISRNDDGLRVKFRLLDAGADGVALPPTLGTPFTVSPDITLPVTTNASGDAVRVAYALTDYATTTAPDDTEAGWLTGPLVASTGNAVLLNLPANARAWLRARSIPGAGAGFKLPSSWVHAAGPVDLSAMPAPTSLTVHGASLDVTLFEWVNPDPTLSVELFFVDGGALVASDATRFGAVRAPGTIRAQLPALTLGDTYTVGARARDAKGGTSSLATLTFTASAPVIKLDPPTDAHGFSGSQDPQYGFPQQDGIYGLAVAATVYPGYCEFVDEAEIARGTGTFGSPVTVAKVPTVQGNWTLCTLIAPNDGLLHQLSARQVRDGATPSDYTTAVVVAPWTPQELPIFARTVGDSSIVRVSRTESADGKSSIISLVVGALVTAVQVHYRTVPIDFIGDDTNFSEDETVDEHNGFLILDPDDFPDRVVSFAIPHAPRNFKVAVRVIPFAGAKEGENKVFYVDAAPPALNALLHATRDTPTTGALSTDITFGQSDAPVTVTVVLDTPTLSTILLTKTLTDPTTLDPSTDSALGGIALPLGKDSVSFRVRLTDVSGQDYWFGPALVDRVPLPNGTVSLSNYRAEPVFVIAFDPDVDTIVYTAHDGRIKTWNRAALVAAGSPVEYIVSQTALDDGSEEDPLPVGADRDGATIVCLGGGTTVLLWDGTLHGPATNPPTAEIQSILVGDRDAKDVTIRPDTQIDELLEVYYREGNTDTALQWVLCTSATDTTIKPVVAGHLVGPADYFQRVDGVGTPVQKLSAIPLARDQITVHGAMIQGEDSGLQSGWLEVVLSLMEQPWFESVTSAYDPATRTLSAIIVAGGHVASASVVFADNLAFTGPLTAQGDVTDGNKLTLSVVLSDAQLGKTWHLRVTPWNAAGESGLRGAAQQDSVFVPAIMGNPETTVDETTTPGSAIVTTTIDDPGAILNQAWTNGTITGALSYDLQKLGVPSTEAATAHTVAGTLHTWKKQVVLDDKHGIGIVIRAHFVDGSTGQIYDTLLDSNKLSDPIVTSVANNGATSTITETRDNDTRAGVGCAQYRIDGGAWIAVDVSTSITPGEFVVQFDVPRSPTAKKKVEIQAKNDFDGGWGTTSTCYVDTYEAPGGASGTVSIDANGVTSVTANLPPGAQSVRWFVQGGTNTTGYPSEASVAATGFIANGNPVNLNAVMTISYGQTAWFMIVPFTGLNATGTALKGFGLRGAYTTTVASKWDTLPGATFIPVDTGNPLFTANASTGVASMGLGVSPFLRIGAQPLRVSSGLTLMELDLVGFLNAGAHIPAWSENVSVRIYRVHRTSQIATSIATASIASLSSAVQFVSITGVGHVVDSSEYSYYLDLFMQNQDGTTGVCQCWALTIGYTQNNPSQGL